MELDNQSDSNGSATYSLNSPCSRCVKVQKRNHSSHRPDLEHPHFEKIVETESRCHHCNQRVDKRRSPHHRGRDRKISGMSFEEEPGDDKLGSNEYKGHHNFKRDFSMGDAASDAGKDAE